MDTAPSVSESIPLEIECCLCPGLAPENQTLRGSKGKFCHRCLAIAKTLTNQELSNRKLRALRQKKQARGLCSRYRCTAKPVEGKTYCLECAEFQKKAVGKYRVKKSIEGKLLRNKSATAFQSETVTKPSTEYRRITVASLLCS